MSLSAISLCSKALIKIGTNGMTSFDENTAEARVASQLYGMVRDGLLSSYPWRFATAQKELNCLVDGPTADYEYAFALPSDLLRILCAGEGHRGNGLTYRVCENVLQTNSRCVTLTYIFRPQEESFPPFFDELLVSKLAAEFCLPLTESTARSEFLNKQTESLLSRAKLIDAQQATTIGLDRFSLIGVRG